MTIYSDGGGTPVTLVVTGASPIPSTAPTAAVVIVHPHPRPHLPFTGFDLGAALVLTALLLAVGALLLITGRRSASDSRRT